MPTYDQFGQVIYKSKELFNLLYVNPDLDLTKFVIEDADQYLQANDELKTGLPNPQTARIKYIDQEESKSIEKFDKEHQANWYMPDEYKKLDIAEWLLTQCKTDAELQRVGQELLLYQDRNLFDLLRYLKYMIDTLRANKLLWGVGRGSSVASYVLYLIGVHRINSMYYDLDIHQFLRE